MFKVATTHMIFLSLFTTSMEEKERRYSKSSNNRGNTVATHLKKMKTSKASCPKETVIIFHCNIYGIMHGFLEIFVLKNLIGANNTQCILISLFVIIFVLVYCIVNGSAHELTIIYVSFPRSAVIVLKGLTMSFNGLTDLAAIFYM